jgi:lactoylglutathione lyase
MQILVNIDVPELGAAVDFYCAAFGLHIGRRLGSEAVELLGGSSPIYLLCKREGSSPSSATRQLRDYGRHWSPVHLDIVVPELDAAVARAIQAGAKPEGQPEAAAWGRIAMFSDPFGHGFCLVQFTGRGYDEIAG